MVGVQRVGVVTAYQEGRCLGAQEALFSGVQCDAAAPQGVLKQGTHGPLLGVGAHFFIIEACKHRDRRFVFACQEGLQAGEGALQVVELRRAEEFPFRSPGGGFLAVDQGQLAGKDVFGPGAGFLRYQLGEGFFPQLACGKQGAQVDLVVQLDALIHLMVHVYGKVGDEQQVAVEVHQPALDACFGSDEHPSCKRERAVQPS